MGHWATFHEVIRRHHEPSLITAATLEFQGQLPDVEQEFLATKCFQDYFETASEPAYVGSGAMVVKRSIFDRAGGFDDTMSVGEDLDFYFRLGTSRDFVRVLLPVTLAYRRHTGNMSTDPPALYSGAVELFDTGGRRWLLPAERRARERDWRLLGRMVRPVALSVSFKSGLRVEAWRLYRKSFLMNARLKRFRFLAGFPFYGLSVTRSKPVNSNQSSARYPFEWIRARKRRLTFVASSPGQFPPRRQHAAGLIHTGRQGELLRAHSRRPGRLEHIPRYNCQG